MEYVVFFGAFLLFLLAVAVTGLFHDRNRKKQLRRSLSADYGKETQKKIPIERFERLGSYYQKHKKAGQLDDITWNDLHMDEIFRKIDFTHSAFGEEYLYYLLRNTGAGREELCQLEEMIGFFSGHPDERVACQLLFLQLGHMGKYSLYDYLDHLDVLGERSNGKAYLGDLLYLPFLALLPFATSVGVTGLVALAIYHIVTYYRQKGEIEPYIISFSYIMKMADICEELVKIPAAPCKEQWEEIRAANRSVKEMRRGAFWVLKGNNPGGGSPLDAIFDYIRMLFHVDLIVFNRMLGQLRKRQQDVDTLFGLLGRVESAISIGQFRVSLKEGYCIPEFAKEAGLEIRKGYHPMLAAPVKNDISAGRGVLLTGSNASGKSTFLRMAAVNAVLAQTIHTCTAERYRAGFFQILSAMSLQDDLENGESYYIVEIKALKRILEAKEHTDRRILCFVDEVLRGTNTVERIAAATQILRSLSAQEYLCFAATHDIELTELLQDAYDNYHFEEEIQNGDVLFSYQLKSGRAVSRNAIRLLEIMGYQETIISRAQEMAERFSQTGVWSG